jgi:hypothetical protein
MIYHWPKLLAPWSVHLVDTMLICILQSIEHDEVVDTGVPLRLLHAYVQDRYRSNCKIQNILDMQLQYSKVSGGRENRCRTRAYLR